MKQTGVLRGRDYELELYANAVHDPHAIMASTSEGAFCTYVGTLIYAGSTGLQATSKILVDFVKNGPGCLDKAFGCYALLVGNSSAVSVITDEAGLFHVYCCENLPIVSSSFIAAAVSLPKRTLDRDKVREYVMFGTTFGVRTIVGGVTLSKPDREIVVKNGKLAFKHLKTRWRCIDSGNEEGPPAVGEQLVEAIDLADSYYSQLASAFGGRATAALTGGYDSRLNLALLLRHGIQPYLFVYGNNASADVLTAREICRREKLNLAHHDREKGQKLGPDEYWERQESVFHELDGLTQYGYACQPFEGKHRRERANVGAVVVNGGGGEIWRDYWKLSSRSRTARQFVDEYFAGRFDGLRGGRQAYRTLLDNVALSVLEIVESEKKSLTTPVIQSLYPRLRLRYWQGKNNSVDNGYGPAITPFSELHFAIPAARIRLQDKRHGKFQRALIKSVSPSLAKHMSTYGFSFDRGPGLLGRAKTDMTVHLPSWLRARRRRAALSRDRMYFQQAEFIRARFGSGGLLVQREFDLSRLGDSLAFSRALSVERMRRDEWL